MFPPMQFLMFTTTIECFMAASTALVCLNMAKGTNKLIGIHVTHDLAQLGLSDGVSGTLYVSKGLLGIQF